VIPRPRIATFRRLAQERGEQAFEAFVRRADDRRLEQIAGSQPGLRVVFGAMEQAYVPEKANGFDGELQYDLRRANGETVHWTLRLDPERASARPGPANDPALTVKLTLADFLRMAGRDLDPGKALLTGRLDLEGDFALAQRLGEMFGQPAAL
jgi:putative sterol carrier protein